MYLTWTFVPLQQYGFDLILYRHFVTVHGKELVHR